VNERKRVYVKGRKDKRGVLGETLEEARLGRRISTISWDMRTKDREEENNHRCKGAEGRDVTA